MLLHYMLVTVAGKLISNYWSRASTLVGPDVITAAPSVTLLSERSCPLSSTVTVWLWRHPSTGNGYLLLKHWWVEQLLFCHVSAQLLFCFLQQENLLKANSLFLINPTDPVAECDDESPLNCSNAHLCLFHVVQYNSCWRAVVECLRKSVECLLENRHLPLLSSGSLVTVSGFPELERFGDMNPKGEKVSQLDCIPQC